MEGESIGESAGGRKHRRVSWREKVQLSPLEGERIGESVGGRKNRLVS